MSATVQTNFQKALRPALADLFPRPVPRNYYRRFCISDIKDNSLAEVTLRAPVLPLEEFSYLGHPYVVLDQVYVVPRLRGQGLAPRLLRMAQEEARAFGWSILCRPSPHRSNMSMKRLVAFYRAQGWGRSISRVPVWLAWPPA